MVVIEEAIDERAASRWARAARSASVCSSSAGLDRGEYANDELSWVLKLRMKREHT